jgi:Mg-chelatase subunit ChlD/ribosomal protein L7/L12
MTDNLLKFTATLDRYQLPADQPKSELSCQVMIEPNVITGDGGEMGATASICLVFDCSSSMMGRKFQAAIETAKMIVDILHERHCISLVAFQSESHIVFKNAVPTEGEKDFIKEQIDQLDSHLGGSTNMSAGIESGMDVLSEGTADAEIIVLLSDGEPIFVERAQMAADVASQRGIQIFAVGIGESYNADQLLRLVTPSNGAVFGDSDAEKISEIFYDLISRIDRIFSTNVKLNFTFDERVHLKQVFKTSPERALYDSSTINSTENSLELRVGNIEGDKVYEFLLLIEVDSLDIGAIALITARLQYDINHLGLNRQAQEIILAVNYTEDDSLQSGTNEKIGNALRSASMVQLSDELVQACSKSDNDRALQAIDELQQRCDEENNTALQQHLDNMKSQLSSGGKVSDKDRNDFLLASTTAPPKAVLFDLILIDPGSETIRLLREIRYATSMGLREIADIIRCRNSVVTVFKNRASAEQLQQRLVKLGAKVKVHAREEVEEDK